VASKNLKIKVAENIRKMRQKLKMTQEESAEKSGFHYKYYQKIESGTVNLTLDSIEKIAKTFGVDPKKLMF
jgi:transcriptional regulator with XRE-family HTH domain